MGIFITFEGPEGSGKTTIIKKIFNFLLEQNLPVILTREPGGVEVAEQIRKIILDKDNIAIDKKTEALLYAASRRQHLVEKIFPALAENKIVLCDRFIDSSLAYQGHGRLIDIDELLSINHFATEGVMPDLTILFDIDPEIGLTRIEKSRQHEKNRLDIEKLKFHTLVRQGYLDLAIKYEERFVKIDASLSIDEVFETCKDIILNFLEGKVNV